MNLKIWQQRLLMGVVGLLAFLVVAGNLIPSSHWINQPFPGFFLYSNLTVSPDFLPGWSGREKGLRFLDRVIAVDGKRINRPAEIYEWVRTRPAKTPFQYTVERGGRLLSLTISSLNFSFQDWLLTYGIYLLTGLSFLAIGITPFYLRSPSPSAAPLLFMVSAVFVWFATTFDFMTTHFLPNEVRALAFAFTPSAGIHLGLSFSKVFSTRRAHLLALCVIYGISMLLCLAYSLSFYGRPETWHVVLRISYVYSLLAAIIFMGLLTLRLRHPESDLEKSRLRVVVGGSLLGFFIPTFGTVLVSSFEWGIPHNALLLAAVFFPLSITYALLQYNLFNIDAILKVGLTRGGLTALLLMIYVAVVFLLGVPFQIYHNEFLVPLLFALLVALLFNPLLRWIDGAVGRFVYRREYDPVQLQGEISTLLRSLSKPQMIAERCLSSLSRQIGIDNACLFYRPKDGENYVGVFPDPSGGQGTPEDLLPPWIDTLEARKKGISKDQVESDPAYEEKRSQFMGIFRELKLELLIPMIFEEKLLGFVCLGKKKSGRSYSADDFRLLSNLADQLALAIKNGVTFEESEKGKEKYQFLYDQSEEMNRRLIQMDQKQKQFVANISHELRTPVSTILGYSEVLLDPTFTGDNRIILERIVTNGRGLSQQMDGLLEFSRIEAGTMSVKLQEVKVKELCQSLEAMTIRLLKNRSIGFSMQIDSSLEAIRTDGKTLQQILNHLLTNALKFTHKGEIALGFRSMSEGDHGFVEFCVTDTGIGISPKDQEVIFEEFRQLDGSSKRQYGGTGLGLSLCKKLAHSLGGRIEVESEVGHGSTFSLILPVGRTVAAPVTELGDQAGQTGTGLSLAKLYT